jgi:hypothetical protein
MDILIFLIAWIGSNWAMILNAILAINGFLAALVKFVPTLPGGHWLLPILQFLGNFTNRQVSDKVIREALNKK